MAELQGDNITNFAGNGPPNAPYGILLPINVGKIMTVTMSANQTPITSDTATRAAFDTIYQGNDTDGTFGWDPVNHWFQPKLGFYLVTAVLNVAGANGDSIQKTFLNIQKDLTGDTYPGSTLPLVSYAPNDGYVTATAVVGVGGTNVIFTTCHFEQVGASNGTFVKSGSYMSIIALGNQP